MIVAGIVPQIGVVQLHWGFVLLLKRIANKLLLVLLFLDFFLFSGRHRFTLSFAFLLFYFRSRLLVLFGLSFLLSFSSGRQGFFSLFLVLRLGFFSALIAFKTSPRPKVGSFLGLFPLQGSMLGIFPRLPDCLLRTPP